MTAKVIINSVKLTYSSSIAEWFNLQRNIFENLISILIDIMIRKSLNNALRKSEVIGNFFIMITTLANDNEIENFLVKVHMQEFIKVINQDQVPKKIL